MTAFVTGLHAVRYDELQSVDRGQCRSSRRLSLSGPVRARTTALPIRHAAALFNLLLSVFFFFALPSCNQGMRYKYAFHHS